LFGRFLSLWGVQQPNKVIILLFFFYNKIEMVIYWIDLDFIVFIYKIKNFIFIKLFFYFNIWCYKFFLCRNKTNLLGLFLWFPLNSFTVVILGLKLNALGIGTEWDPSRNRQAGTEKLWPCQQSWQLTIESLNGQKTWRSQVFLAIMTNVFMAVELSPTFTGSL